MASRDVSSGEDIEEDDGVFVEGVPQAHLAATKRREIEKPHPFFGTDTHSALGFARKQILRTRNVFDAGTLIEDQPGEVFDKLMLVDNATPAFLP